MISRSELIEMNGGGKLRHIPSSQKKPLAVRLSGKLKTWKTRPLEFLQPVKYGLYSSFYVNEQNCEFWEKL